MTSSISGFGADYEHRISKARAVELLAPYPLPRIGYETDVSVKRDEYGLPLVLTVQNLGGRFVLVCASAPTKDWQSIFGVQA